ncbi:MAG: hypothetical protein J5979_01055 [Lachnospiraceae bacterium]|nr:hypothetical protein [Lachnospiraceae bacterium]
MGKFRKKLVSFYLVLAMIITMGSGNVQIVQAEDNYTTSAVEFPLNGNWGSDHYITDTHTVDYYKITVPSDGKLTIKIMTYMKYLYYDFYNVDLSTRYHNANYYGGTESSPATSTYSYILSAGTYYLKISKDSTGRYKLYGEFESFGANDAEAYSYDSPFALSANTTVTGALTADDSEDWYRFKVPSDGKYAVKLVTYMKYVDYNVYNSDLSKTIDSKSYYGGTETSPVTANYNYMLSAGTYYIKISKGDSGKYLLTWSALTKENCDHEYESSMVSATYTQKGYTIHTCKICGDKYKDSYTKKLKLGRGSLGNIYSGRRYLHVYFHDVSGATGYQFRWSRNKTFKSGVRKGKIKNSYSDSVFLRKLTKNKRYYIQVRAYRTENGKTLYGKWSSKKSGKPY